MTELSESLRILFVSAGIPFPTDNGSKIRTASILQALHELGHRVHLFSLGGGNAEGVREALTVCEDVSTTPHAISNLSKKSDYWNRLVNLPQSLPYGTSRYLSSKFKAAVKEASLSGKFDVLFCDTLDCMINVPSDCPIPVVLNNQNIEHQILMRFLKFEPNRARRTYAKIEANKLQRFEQSSCSRADLTMVCSEVDASILREMSPGSVVTVVSNVVDANAYKIVPEPSQPILIYTGGMDWFPNRDAVEYFAHEILPIIRKSVPEVKLIIAGRNPSPEFVSTFSDIANMEFTGSVPDMRPIIVGAQISIVPLRIGSGTRLKILEAAASGRPVVSTSLGAEGLNFEDGKDILIADTPEAFASATVALLQNAELRCEIAKNSNGVVKRSYSAEVVKTQLQQSLRIATNVSDLELSKETR
jgi:polysaccharide biosynthesis protein PslH